MTVEMVEAIFEGLTGLVMTGFVFMILYKMLTD